MSFQSLAAARYSVRTFSNRPVEREKIDYLLQTARLAPTATNSQPQRILVIESREALQKLPGCTECHFNAPLALLVCYDQHEAWQRTYDGAGSGVVDASIVTTYLMMAAMDVGLGSTWVMHFDPAAMIEAYQIPSWLEPVALLVLGYPAADAQPSPRHNSRKVITETAVYNSFDWGAD